LNELNEVARHRPRLGLIITLAQVRDNDCFIITRDYKTGAQFKKKS